MYYIAVVLVGYLDLGIVGFDLSVDQDAHVKWDGARTQSRILLNDFVQFTMTCCLCSMNQHSVYEH